MILKLKKVVFFLGCFFVLSPIVGAEETVNLCSEEDVLKVMKLIGSIIQFLKIAIMLLLIVFGMLDLGKVIFSDAEKEMKPALNKFMKRCFLGVLVFFVPTIVMWMLNIIDADSINKQGKATKCINCVLNIKKCGITNNAGDNIEEEVSKEISGTYYTNSINGINYVIYEQQNTKWSTLSYANDDIANSGSSIIATSVIASGYDSKMDPHYVYYSGYKNYSPSDAINNLSKQTFKCQIKSMTNIEIISDLKKGNVAIILVYGQSKSGSSKFTNMQHYMALIDIKQDGSQIYVGNSYNNESITYTKSGWYNASEVLTSVIQVHMCEPKKG